MIFVDREDAGRQLAQHLLQYQDQNPIILALPRGGVPVGFEVAKQLHAPLDVFLVRKLGVPHQEELAMGAIATGGVRVLNEDIVRSLKISHRVIDAVAAREKKELERRETLYRGNRPAPDVSDRLAILVDDGLATGSTMRAAIMALKLQHPARIIAAVPVAVGETCDILQQDIERMLCLETPDPFSAVGIWYKNFSQTTDEEVRELLEQASHWENSPKTVSSSF